MLNEHGGFWCSPLPITPNGTLPDSSIEAGIHPVVFNTTGVVNGEQLATGFAADGSPDGGPLPEPATMLLLGSGLLGLAGYGRKKFFKK